MFNCIFWWTNETINIWSHIFGWMLFFGLTLYDLCLLNIHAPFGDKIIVALLLICFQDLQQFYLVTVLVIFVIAMILQIPKLNVNGNVKLIVFVAWAVYGVLPTLHWSIAMGGMDNPIVRLLLPRVLGMYAISGLAFVIYLMKIPERLFPGWVDYVGSSHQWWHALVVLALYYWHNTGMLYVEYRMNHGCPANMRL
ncbi:hypothetical protein M0802_016914 [Mischocyttarus mexicanus]|nr:hypothetical protein M0802_016914 [Mischocyttarus mexicanus]